MHQEVELEAEAQQHPVLPREVGKERLPIAEIADVLDGKDALLLRADLHLRVLLLLLLPGLLRRIALLALLVAVLPAALLRRLLVLLLLLDGRPPGGVLPVGVPAAPLLQQLRPSLQALAEPRPGLQVLYTLRQLALADPAAEVLVASWGRLPDEADVVEALILVRQREAREGVRELLRGQVLDQGLAEPERLLLLRELHGRWRRLGGVRGVAVVLGSVRRAAAAVLLLLLCLTVVGLLLGFLPVLHLAAGILGSRLPADPRRRGRRLPGQDRRLTLCLVPLVLERQPPHARLVLLRGLAHDHQRNPPELCLIEACKHPPAFGCHQVVPHLHDDTVALQHGYD
mmetsp:Transcript_149186/g.415808  ORF Transcript_149186/g.415808 Transcript_149186/m.415808 type:complete len:343 (+) Transcript_149186:901-1929(+)